MNRAEPLVVLAIVDETAVGALFGRVFGPIGDRALVATDLAEGLALAASERPDLTFVDVSLGHNAGLALVHHLRAVAPDAAVYALARPDALSMGAQAIALGGAGIIVMPPSGDELVTAASEIRAKRAALRERLALEAEADLARRGAAAAAAVGGLAEAGDRAEATARLATIFAEASGAAGVAVYVPASEGSRELARAAVAGDLGDAPTFVEEMGLMGWARAAGCELVPLATGPIAGGHVVLCGGPEAGSARRASIDLVASQAATMLALLAERERSTRGSMKDLTTSAYTFSYFVDVAGREIDKARRYGRRFALATIAVDESVSAERSSELAEVVLSAVRDTDVLARIDEREFYLLMPETGGLGAQSCRRRVLDRLGARGGRRNACAPSGLAIGVATFPHDGADLSRLLRAAKRRAEASTRSCVRTLELETKGLADVVDALLAARDGADGNRAIEGSPAEASAIAVAAVLEAARGGGAFAAAAQHPGLGFASAIRAALAHDRDAVELATVDVRAVDRCADLEVLAVVAEHGAYALAGRSSQGTVRAVGSADPLLVDLLVARLGEAAGTRLVE